ncbi:MAG: hypothetical protein JXR76_19330 [Deltaproteobacteria bacterium]|nr:hypothetical protein [Deltaproteobacteria bacterium]
MYERTENSKDSRRSTLLKKAVTALHQPVFNLRRTDEPVANLAVTATEYGFADMAEAISFKQTESEKCALPKTLNDRFKARWPRLEEMLNTAYGESILPQAPAIRLDRSRWFIEKRKMAMSQHFFLGSQWGTPVFGLATAGRTASENEQRNIYVSSKFP